MGKKNLNSKKTTYVLAGSAVLLILASQVVGHFKHKPAKNSVKVAVTEKVNTPAPVKKTVENQPELPPPPPPPVSVETSIPTPKTESPAKVEENKVNQEPKEVKATSVKNEKEQKSSGKKAVVTEKKQKKELKKKTPVKVAVAKKEAKKHKKVKHRRVKKPVVSVKEPKGLLEEYVYTERKVSPDEFVRKVIGKFTVIGTVCNKTAERDCRLVLGAREIKAGQKVGELKVKSVSLDSVVFILPDGQEYRYTFDF